MTGAAVATLWIPAYAGMTVWWDCLSITLTFDSSPIKQTFEKPTVIPA